MTKNIGAFIGTPSHTHMYILMHTYTHRHICISTYIHTYAQTHA